MSMTDVYTHCFPPYIADLRSGSAAIIPQPSEESILAFDGSDNAHTDSHNQWYTMSFTDTVRHRNADQESSAGEQPAGSSKRPSAVSSLGAVLLGRRLGGYLGWYADGR